LTTALARLGVALGRFLRGADRLELTVGPEGPRGDILVPSEGDGRWEVDVVQGRPCLTPSESSHYLYFVLPPEFLAHARAAGHGLWLDVEYHGDRFAQFRIQYAASDRNQPHDGLYIPAEQRWTGQATGLRMFRRALFPLPDFDSERTQNQGASFRVEFRREVLLSRLVVSLTEPPDLDRFPAIAPLPELRKMPGRFYPINYLFIEITNACNFKCTWCPDEIMGRRRGFMKKEKVFRILDEIASKRSWLGPLYPLKLHQMGEPMLHPDLVEIVAYAEARGVGIELNTNCGLITRERIDGLFSADLTNMILSYQTPDAESFKTRKARRLVFDEYRDKVRLAVERKVAMGARTNLEIDIMNTKYADGYRIVSEDEQALAFLEDWIAFCHGLEAKYGLVPRSHDRAAMRSRQFLDQDENGSRYTLLDGVHLIWKRCHSWGNVIKTNEAGASGAVGSGGAPSATDESPTYCPAPYDQFVIQWNGDVTTCCTDYEGRTKTANVFAESIESVWTGATLRQRKKDMLEGRLLDVCARCQGLK
jgi:MoaA/NifB/PqqE/SkfB family radical SAM enzyme